MVGASRDVTLRLRGGPRRDRRLERCGEPVDVFDGQCRAGVSQPAGGFDRRHRLVESDAHAAPPLVANVTPRSENDRCAGPAVFTNEYGPVIETSAMFVTGVRRVHGPNRTSNWDSSSRTRAVVGATPVAKANTR